MVIKTDPFTVSHMTTIPVYAELTNYQGPQKCELYVVLAVTTR